MISKFPNKKYDRRISTPRLNTLLCLYLEPINLIISQGSKMILNLEVGFPLRCFQRLSIPDIATQRCSWRNNWYTRGQSTSVLSYQKQIFSRIDACSRQETNLSYAYYSTVASCMDYTFIHLPNGKLGWLIGSLYGVILTSLSKEDFPRYCPNTRILPIYISLLYKNFFLHTAVIWLVSIFFIDEK